MKIIRSSIAMSRCLEIYKTEPKTERASSAIFLLGSIADEIALPWIPDFLKDSNEGVRLNGLRVLQNILYGYESLSEQQVATAKELLNSATLDECATVRERAKGTLNWLNGVAPEELDGQ